MTPTDQPPTGEPHHALNNPADHPDPTEYPDPYERREDPRDPEHPDVAASQEGSTSEPHPPRNRNELLDRSDD